MADKSRAVGKPDPRSKMERSDWSEITHEGFPGDSAIVEYFYQWNFRFIDVISLRSQRKGKY